MKAIAYSRVSTEDQVSFGVSLAAQEDKIRQYADLYNIEIVETISDPGFSAKDTKRPGIQRALRMMEKKEVEAVVVARLDRLTRSVRDLSAIIDLANKKGIALISVGEHIDTGSAAGRMILNMLGTISQWEREVIGERTATALRFKRDSGRQYNKEALYGFRHMGGRLVPCSEEQRVIEKIVSMHESGFSYGRTARALNTLQQSTRSGGAWHSEQVKRVVVNASIRKRIDGVNLATAAA